MDGERATLAGRFRVERVPETGSTNADLVAAARAGAPAGAVLVAAHQTLGRGRLGRTWSAPPGASLLMSVLLRPAPGLPLHGATQAVALAARAACHSVAGVRPELKWPNDLLVADKKLAGVLAEAVAGPAGIDAVVVGIGLNVRWGTDVPEDLADRLVALDQLTGLDLHPDDLVEPILAGLAELLEEWEHRPPDLHRSYRNALATLGREVRVELPARTFTGRALDVTAEGALVVDDAGHPVEVSAGEVIHLRDA